MNQATNKIEVISENESFIVVYKPVGMDFHGDDGLVDCLRQDFPEALGIHRLDKETSGLIIFARDKETQKELSFLFEERKVAKTYLALSLKKPKKKQGLVKGDLLKARGGSYRLARSLDNPSITRFLSFPLEEGLRAFYLFPKTGKTHQLRVVMKSLGSPILGDQRYGSDESDRMYLHAIEIGFSWKGSDYRFKVFPTSGSLFDKHQGKLEEIYDHLQ